MKTALRTLSWTLLLLCGSALLNLLAFGTTEEGSDLDHLRNFNDGYKVFSRIGLAGELGAGITLVSEILPKELRAIGTSLVAGIGLLGAVVAYFTVEIFGDWRIAYFVGGGLGFGLLLLRVGVTLNQECLRKSQAKNM